MDNHNKHGAIESKTGTTKGVQGTIAAKNTLLSKGGRLRHQEGTHENWLRFSSRVHSSGWMINGDTLKYSAKLPKKQWQRKPWQNMSQVGTGFIAKIAEHVLKGQEEDDNIAAITTLREEC